MPHIYGIYLIQRSILENPQTRPSFIYRLMDADIAMTMNLRTKVYKKKPPFDYSMQSLYGFRFYKQDVFMVAVNLEYYGHLVDNEVVSSNPTHPDLWQVESNPEDWEAKYLHPQYKEAVSFETLNEMVNFLHPGYRVKADSIFFPALPRRLLVPLVHHEILQRLYRNDGSEQQVVNWFELRKFQLLVACFVTDNTFVI